MKVASWVSFSRAIFTFYLRHSSVGRGSMLQIVTILNKRMIVILIHRFISNNRRGFTASIELTTLVFLCWLLKEVTYLSVWVLVLVLSWSKHWILISVGSSSYSLRKWMLWNTIIVWLFFFFFKINSSYLLVLHI